MLRGSKSYLISLLQIEMHKKSRDIHHFRKEDAMWLMNDIERFCSDQHASKSASHKEHFDHHVAESVYTSLEISSKKIKNR